MQKKKKLSESEETQGTETVAQRTSEEAPEEEPKFVTEAAESFKNIWHKLNETQKKILKDQASNRVLETKEQINEFWQTRNFDKIIGLAKHPSSAIHESVHNDPLVSIMNKLK